jgi:hypothetical protein
MLAFSKTGVRLAGFDLIMAVDMRPNSADLLESDPAERARTKALAQKLLAS